MKRITQDFADKMVEDFLIQISKSDFFTSGMAKNSLDIMDNQTDNLLFTAIVYTQSNQSFFNKKQIFLKNSIVSSLQNILTQINRDSCSNKEFAKELSSYDIKAFTKSTKFDFALNSFVNAYFEYERLEKKYPELMKIM